MGVNTRHLYLEHRRRLTAREFVHQEIRAKKSREQERRRRQRRLDEPEPEPEPAVNWDVPATNPPAPLPSASPASAVSSTAGSVASSRAAGSRGNQFVSTGSAASIRSTLNWCSNDNPLGKSVCTPVKSQNKCGSCWAFAATDAIETAVAISSKNDPRALSSQQFLDCSKRDLTTTFTYCWADGNVQGATWLLQEMKWASQNNGCEGGMTHAAFTDAAQLHLGLVMELQLPYEEAEDTSRGVTSGNSSTCGYNQGSAAASIANWEQVVGKDCSSSKDPTQLLKMALQNQPISVAINSGDSFKDYKTGIYHCPNNGNFKDSREIDHAILLVGYNKEPSGDEYWILKNSYSTQWGEKGFLRLRMDNKINCGINIFPVVPTGAKAGSAQVSVDGGGDKVFFGVDFSAWIALGVVVSIATTVLTIVGAMWAKRRRLQMRETL